MKMMWHGTLTFGRVQGPIRLYRATRRRRIEFRLLHAPDYGRIQYRKFCSEEDEPVPDEEIVRGYRIEGEWVVVDDAELEGVEPRLTRTIEVREFVDLHDIDPVYFRTPYYLAPDEGGEEIYVMLREAIRRSGKVGVAEFVLMHREHLAALRTRGDALVLETMYYPQELIDDAELELPVETRLREGEIRMAVQLIQNLAGPFDASRYRNEYRERVIDLLRHKARGELPEELRPPAPPEPTPVIDLTRRLKESLEQSAEERAGGERRRTA